MKYLRSPITPLFLSVLCFSAESSHAARPPPPTGEVFFVASLYQRFAWEALLSAPLDKVTAFIDLPRDELVKILEPKLADLLIADRACARRSQSVCRLDFSPLWASQDPGALGLGIHAMTPEKTVLVTFRYPGDDGEVRLIYDVDSTSLGYRISDIRYESGQTLRAILQQPQ